MRRDPAYHEPRHPIRVVARRTGLSLDVLRVWERRYGVVEPSRSEGGQRLYSDADIERLTLLHRATEAGRAIRRVAGLSSEELAELLQEDEAALAESSRRREEVAGRESARQFLDTTLGAVHALESRRLQLILGQAVMELGSAPFLDLVLAPLLREVGDRWHAGKLTPAHEHAASTVVRSVLVWMGGAFDPPATAPSVLVTTPAGDQHELGAMLVAVVAATEDWRVTQLGASLPAAMVADAARQTEARVVALSAVYAPDPDGLLQYLAALREALDEGVELVIGGAAAAGVAPRLAALGAHYLSGLGELRELLRARRPGG
jgi:DNA-binding transcriptional MerR regulator/methylmalonyl-CoA mutase cobalamin-binding subunit